MVGAALVLVAAPAGAQSGGIPWSGDEPVDTAYAMSIDTTVAGT